MKTHADPRGFLVVPRSLLSLPVLQVRGERLTRYHAVLWLLHEAAWRETPRTVGSETVLLERGQLTHSIAFMAQAWNWDGKSVRLFLQQLQNSSVISSVSSSVLPRGQTIITLHNYEQYQGTKQSASVSDNVASSDVSSVAPAEIPVTLIKGIKSQGESRRASEFLTGSRPHLQVAGEAVEQTSESAKIVVDFIQARTLTWPDQPYLPHSNDRLHTQRWIMAGATVGLVPTQVRQLALGVFADVHARKRAAGHRPPGSLSFFEGAMIDAMRLAATPVAVIDLTAPSDPEPRGRARGGRDGPEEDMSRITPRELAAKYRRIEEDEERRRMGGGA
jgi:hypothetical protein